MTTPSRWSEPPPRDRTPYPGLDGLHDELASISRGDTLMRWSHIGIAACRVGETYLAGFSVRVHSWVERPHPDLPTRGPPRVYPATFRDRAAGFVYDACDERGMRIVPTRMTY